MRCILALQGLNGSGGGVLLSLIAGPALGLRQVSALGADLAAEAFRVAVLAATFFGGLAG